MKVGEYVKYKYENCIYIGKIKFISEVMGFEETLQLDIDNCMEEILKEDIIKSSPNIIDLIDVGDYVNGHRVNYINKDREHFNISFGNEDFNLKSKFNSDIYWLSKEDIKSIITKEQFSQMEYRIGE